MFESQCLQFILIEDGVLTFETPSWIGDTGAVGTQALTTVQHFDPSDVEDE